MNVLLLGGTGPMGIHLSKLLAGSNFEVYITSRSEHKDESHIHYILGNAKQDEFVNKILSKYLWDCIVDFMVYDTVEFKRRVCKLLSSTKQYIFLSSSRVYVETDEPITESTPRLLEQCEDKDYLETDEYALKKAREEDVLYQSRFHNYTIVRPYITYGENRLPLGVWEKETWLRRMLNKKDLVLPRGFLDKYTTLAYGKDVSLCISKLVGEKKSIGNVYNIVGSTAHKWSDILEYYLDQVATITGYRPRVELVERFTIDIRSMCRRWVSDVLNFRFNRTGTRIEWRNYQLIYDREFNRKFDNSQLHSLFPEVLFSDYEHSLGDCLRVFASNPRYNYMSWSWWALQDRLTDNKVPISQVEGFNNKLKYIFIRYIIPLRYIVEY